MTVTDERAPADDDDFIRLGEAGSLNTGSPPSAHVEPAVAETEAAAPDEPVVSPLTMSGAAFLSSAAVGWMLGGIFSGAGARLVGLLGAAVGAGLVALSSRVKASTAVSAAALPVGVLVGLGLVVTGTGGGINPLTAIGQAIQAGGLSHPPVPFDPGWRFLLVVLTCAMATTAASAAVSFNRSRWAALLPAPVVILGVLLQPPGHELVSVAVALLLAVGALAVTYGSELARDSVTGRAFEARRLGKSVGVLGVVVVLIVGLSQLGFLYPPQTSSSVIPPKKPETPPAVDPNQLLFTARMSTPEPLRTGVLDVYATSAWLTPPYDTGRLVDVTSQNLPSFSSTKTNAHQRRPRRSVSVRITVNNIGESRQVPDVADPVAVGGAPSGLQYDPRTQTLQTAGRPARGMSYTVVAASPPTGAELSAAGTPGVALAPYLVAPPMPSAVSDLLANVPPGLDRYERLQFVRNYYYQHAVAAGPGNPVDVPAARVAQILAGKPASPYELTAGEVLLARWAGIPARIGYGYYDSIPTKGDVYNVYPYDGAMWLEAYFAGSGWVPILGHPAQAKSSLDRHPKKKSPQILPNGQLVAQLYVPIEQPGVQLLYSLVQFWLLRGLLPVGIVVLAWFGLPALVKAGRRRRRSRWARRIGPGARIAAAYSEFRDRAVDLNLGHPTLTPLEFLDVTVPDDEHTELAWLVTRSLWGDLVRDQRDGDAEAALRLARSMTRRISAGQPLLLRIAALSSRVSLRDPYSSEVPNLWWSLASRRSLMARFRARLRPGVRFLAPRRKLARP